jgi:hypothetical protein
MKSLIDTDKKNVARNKNYDYLGIMFSILCGIHCLVTPLLIIYLPVVGNQVESIWFHTGIIGFVVFAFQQSIYKHYKVHKSRLVLSLGGVGLVLFLYSYFNELVNHSGEHEHGHHMSDIHADETYLTYIALTGGLLLVSAHILNLRKCKCLSGSGLCTDKES